MNLFLNAISSGLIKYAEQVVQQVYFKNIGLLQKQFFWYFRHLKDFEMKVEVW